MMRLASFVVLVVLMLSASGCYEIKQDEKGRTVKLNKITGEVLVIDGDKIVKLKDEKTVKAEQETAEAEQETARQATLALERPKVWPEQAVVDGTKASLYTKWSSDKGMHYIFHVKKDFREGDIFGRRGFGLQFYDKDFFLVRRENVSVASMTGVQQNGQVKYLQYLGSVFMSAETYQKIIGWDVTWSGFNK